VNIAGIVITASFIVAEWLTQGAAANYLQTQLREAWTPQAASFFSLVIAAAYIVWLASRHRPTAEKPTVTL
jgi:hypothetical protein